MVVVSQHKAGDETSANTTNKTTSPSSLPASSSSSSSDLIITDSCWNRIRQLNKPLRVFVDAGGCSGFTYQFELSSQQEEDDIIYTNENLQVLVDPDSLRLLQGATLDYVQEMIKAAFVVRDNPQSESACGCGSSFAIKNFESNPALD
jgi:iron-sulfur cluster assembly accessory protein